MKKIFANTCWVLVVIGFTIGSCSNQDLTLEQQALSKIDQLEKLIDEANNKSLDASREETIIWFSKEFLKFADWDEANKEQVEKLFGYYKPYEAEKAKYAEELPELERQKVIDILDRGIEQLTQVLDGQIVRRPAPKVDWENIEVGEDMLLSNGKPVFLHDYFSKSVGIPLDNEQVYNDHLGRIYHGGENLYEEHHDRAINSFMMNEDGSFDQELLKEVTSISDKSTGFLIYWNSGLPQWIKHKEPEAQVGRSLFLGFDVDNPLVRDTWGKIARKTGELTKGKKVTQLGYILANEPHWFAEKDYWTQKYGEMNAISSYTLNYFRSWLNQKYQGNIKALNANWQTAYSGFDQVQVEIPMDKAKRGTPLWYDFCRFNMDRGINWFTHIQNELHTANPDANTHIKVMPRYFSEDYRSHGLDFEALTELTTMIGDDAKAQGGRNLKNPNTAEKWEARYAYLWDEVAYSYDFMESVAPNKIHVNSETHFLSLGAWRDLNTNPEYVRSVFWLATLHGMDASMSWFWARDPDGSPEDRLEGDLDFWDPALAGSYAGSANMQPQTVNEVAQVMMDMNSFSEELMALRNQKRPLRLFYSETSAINKKKHMTGLFELYESLYFEGFPIGFATEKIIKKQDQDSWDAILVYQTEYVTDAEFNAVQKYLDQGGTVVIDQVSLKMNEYGAERSATLKPSAGTIVSLDKSEVIEATTVSLDVIAGELADLKLKESNGTAYKGCTWRVVQNENGSYWLNILNIGKQTANLELTWKDGGSAIATNMLTGQTLNESFELSPNGVLLLEVSK
ncbi:hypothetical protein [Reichenbachiella sp.]|uniref:hypothetical protein n=1 Tax=Reichenbachiella sp. TaxID=2184521 RepID=UPI003BB0E2FB